MSTPLAHSARSPGRAQTYADHLSGVVERATAFGGAAASFWLGDRTQFQACIRDAARFHDLGKLEASNQRTMAGGSSGRLPVNHVDAGVAHLLEQGALGAALLVYAHHRGLCSLPEERNRGRMAFRDGEIAASTNEDLPRWLAEDAAALGPWVAARQPSCPWSGLTLRIGLSCLVDADHSDTAEKVSGVKVKISTPLLAEERLAALDRYVQSLQNSRGGRRKKLRSDIYSACRQAEVDERIVACPAPVGSGKTTAVMAHLLRVAARDRLRHVVVVLPFVSIIRQAVDVYRKALTLPGEDESEVVAEHHHQADFETLSCRQFATLWRAPVTVTTAVQFFETLAASRPSRLRKLHELPGSAVFIDEAHAALPARFWDQAWRWVEELASEWGCHFVLASGSLTRFWELPEVVGIERRMPVGDLVPASLVRRAVSAERRRVSYERIEAALSLRALIALAREQSGPTLVVVNTVQSAAVVALGLKHAGADVLHLSTALCPRDRETMLAAVYARLADLRAATWFLVATSCVEAGLDLSFRTALRESASACSLIQVGGRVNREGLPTNGRVIDFRLLPDGMLTINPALADSRAVLADLFMEGRIGTDPGGLSTEALRREASRQFSSSAAMRLRRAEAALDFPGVSSEFRVIDADTRLVVVDRRIAALLKAGKAVSARDLLRASVQVWAAKIRNLGLCPLLVRAPGAELYEWPYRYEPEFLGFMAGLLEQEDFLRSGGAVI